MYIYSQLRKINIVSSHDIETNCKVRDFTYIILKVHVNYYINKEIYKQ